MTNAEIIAAARALINDPDGTFSSDAEMAINLDQVAMDFAHQSQVMRTSAVVNYSAGNAVITLPTDCNEILHVIRSDGTELKFTSSRELAENYPTWLLSTGLPRNYFDDLTGDDQFRLWPTPASNDSLTLFYYQGHVPGMPIALPSRFHISLVWGLAAKAVAKSVSELDDGKLQRFSLDYQAGLNDAISDAKANFNRRPRNFSTESF